MMLIFACTGTVNPSTVETEANSGSDDLPNCDVRKRSTVEEDNNDVHDFQPPPASPPNEVGVYTQYDTIVVNVSCT